MQKRIYQSLGGTIKYDEKVWERFGDRVGWRENREWLYKEDLTFSEKAPEAHLRVMEEDFLRGFGLVVIVGFIVCVSSLASRLVDCNI